MNIVLQREPSINDYTFGKLLIDGHYFSETLEDVIREQKNIPVEAWKVQDKTAIPAGTYTIIIDFSSRFKKLMPHLIGVDGFTGIRIHPGNTSANTDGCILVGMSRGEEPLPLRESVKAFDALMTAFSKATDKITITVCNPNPQV